MADGGPAPSVPAAAAAADNEMDIDVQAIADGALRQQLSDWVGSDKANRTSTSFYYSLNHRYVEEGFSVNSLHQNEKDRDLSRPFVDLVNTLPIEVFLALLERDEDAEENGTPRNGSASYFVRKLVDLDGHAYAAGFPLQDTFNGIVRPVLDPPQSLNHLEAVLIFIPRDAVAKFFLSLHKITNKTVLAAEKSLQDLQKILIGYANLCIPPGPRRTRLMPTLKELVIGILEMEEKMDYECLTADVFDPVSRAVSRVRDWALLEQIVIRSKGSHGLGLTKWVGVLVKGGHVALQDVDKWMTACVTSSSYIHKRCEALELFLTGSDGEGGTRSWAVKVLSEKMLQDPPKGWFSFEDGKSLVAILFRLFEFKEAAMHLTAFAEKHGAQITLMIGAVVQLNELFSVATPPTIPILGVGTLFNKLAKRTVDVLDISKLCTSLTLPLRRLAEIAANKTLPNKSPLEYYMSSIHSTAQSPMLPIKPEQLGQFMSALFRQKVKDSTLMQLAFKTVVKAPLIRRPEIFIGLWLPFLQELIGILETNKMSLSTRRYGHMFAALLEAFISSNKGPRPEARVWIAQVNNIRCRCTPCAVIRKFISDPTTKYEGDNATVDQVNHIKRNCLDGLNERTVCEHDLRTGRVTITKIGSYTPDTESKWALATQTTREQIQRFDSSKLKQILGADFDMIWNLEDLTLPEPPVRFPLAPPVPRQDPRQQAPACFPQHPVPLPPKPPFPPATYHVPPNQPLSIATWKTSVPPSYVNLPHMNPTWTANWNASRTAITTPHAHITNYVSSTPPLPMGNTPMAPTSHSWGVVNFYIPAEIPVPMGNNPNAPVLPSIQDVTMGLPPVPPLPPAIRPLGQPLNNRTPMPMPLPPPPPPTAPPRSAVTTSGRSLSNGMAPPPPTAPRYPTVTAVGRSQNNGMPSPASPESPAPRPAVRSLGPALNGRFPPRPTAVSPVRPRTQVPVPTPSSTTPATPSNRNRSLSDSPRAYAMYASEIEGSLRKKFPNVSNESLTKALRKRWDALEEKDKAMYKELAKEKSSQAVGGVSGSATSTKVSGSGSKYGSASKTKVEIRTPVQRSNSDLELLSVVRSVPSGSRSCPIPSQSSRASGRPVPRTPLQATSGNTQRPGGSVPNAAAAGIKRKFSGGHRSTRPAPSLREATLARQPYYPPVAPTRPAAKSKASARTKPEGIDLTLDD